MPARRSRFSGRRRDANANGGEENPCDHVDMDELAQWEGFSPTLMRWQVALVLCGSGHSGLVQCNALRAFVADSLKFSGVYILY